MKTFNVKLFEFFHFLAGKSNELELAGRVLSESKLDNALYSDDEDLQGSVPDPPSISLLRQLKLALKASDPVNGDEVKVLFVAVLK